MKAAETPTREMKREPSKFTDRVTADGRDGWPVAADRYRLVINRACPWAHRAVIVRKLMGLDEAISLAVTDPVQEIIDDDCHWVFTPAMGCPDGLDSVLGIHALREAYLARDPDYTGGVSVPALVDIGSGVVVTNDFTGLTVNFATEWGTLARAGAPDL